MTTNRDWLYSLEPAELTAWFDSERESCAQHADQREREKVDGGESYDSREKLEVEIYRHIAYGDTSSLVGVGVGDALEWLDRQAAITEREIFNEMPYIRDKMHGLQKTVDELTADRDNLAADLAGAMERIERYKSAMRDIGRAVDWCEDKGMA